MTPSRRLSRLGLAALLACGAVSAAGQGGSQDELIALTVSADTRSLAGLEVVEQLSARTVPFVVVADRDSRSTTVTVECKPGEYVVRSGKLISEPLRLSSGDCASHRVTMFFRAFLSGRLVFHGTAPPLEAREAFIQVSRCAGNGGATLIGRYRARIATDGTWSTSVPADCLDPVILVDSFVPIGGPRIGLTLGEHKNLGTVQLERGAPVTVRVENGQHLPLSQARVALVPSDSLESTVAVLLSGGEPSTPVQGMTDSNGYVQLVAQGTGWRYVVASHSTGITVEGPLQLQAVGATLIAGIRGEVPVEFAVSGGTWLDAGTRLIVLGTPQVAGRWVPSALVEVPLRNAGARLLLPTPGKWRFELYSEAGGSRALLERVERDLRVDSPQTVAFDITRNKYRVRVTLSGEPVSGRIRLRRTLSPDLPTTEATTNKQGLGAVSLQQSGEYLVEFSSIDGRVQSSRTVVTFASPAELVQVRLPAGTVQGAVVFPDGRPAPGAIITARFAQLDDPEGVRSWDFSRRADERGLFTLLGLAGGDWEIQAALGQSVTRPELLTVGQSSMSNVRLTLIDRETLTGRVIVSSGQAVVGARGMVFPEPEQPGQLSPSVQFLTDLDGYFKAALDRPSRVVHIQMYARGLPVTSFRVPTDSEPLLLRIPPEGGELRLVFDKSERTPGGTPEDINLYVLIDEHGAILGYAQMLAMQVASIVPIGRDVGVITHSLAPGTWRLVKFPSLRAAALYFSGQWPLPAGQQFTVPVRGTVQLDLRAPR